MARPRWGVCWLALFLAVAAGPILANSDEIDWQSPDGAFPDHGGCTYFGPTGHSLAVHNAAEELRSARKRASDTNRVLAMVPPPRFGGILPRAAGVGPAGSAPCSGIDDCIQAVATAAGVPMTYLTTDVEFLRRVRLDLTGRIPTPEEVLLFVSDGSETKREDLVDRLLLTPEWADRWAVFLGDLYRNTQVTAQVNRFQFGRDSFHLYLRDSLLENKPYDRMAREMIAAEGLSDGRTYPETYTSFEHFRSVYQDFHQNPVRASPVGYIVGGRTTGGPIQDTYDSLAFFVARDFLGVSLMDCVLCHDGEGHLDALSVWGGRAKRLEGWQIAAYFADIPRYQSWRTPGRRLPVNPQTGRPVNANYYRVHDLAMGQEQRVGNGDTAGVYLGQTEGGNRPDRLHQQRVVESAYPFEGSPTVSPGLRLREQLGIHLTSDPQFARAAVNYVWRHFFSRGFVEPPDQFDFARMDPASPPPAGWDIQPSHPQLLEWLAQGFRNSGFDLKWLMREITTSQTYQLSSRYDGVFNPLHEKYFVRRHARRLAAEEVHDALVIASGRGTAYNASRTLRGLQFAMQFPDVVNMPPGNNRRVRPVRQLLQAFTPGNRDGAPRSDEGSPLQALTLMNSSFVLGMIRTNVPVGTIARALEQTDDLLVTNLYLSFLGRYPSEAEVAEAVAYIQAGNRRTRTGDLVWALVNRTEFYFNY